MSGRQFFKAILWLICSLAACFLVLHLSQGRAVIVFEEILSAFLVLAMFLVPASVALFNYVEAISKELTDLRAEVDRGRLMLVIERLSALKREVLYNGILIFCLFLIERALKGVCVFYLKELGEQQFSTINLFLLSLRFGLFVVSLVAAGNQMGGLLVAISFRDVIAKNRK